jgi:hypothetical protein
MPAHILSILDGADLERKPRIAFLLLTSDADSGARAALLSVGELLATSPRSIVLALWPKSRTTANLARSSDATLLVVDEHGAFHVRISVKQSGVIATKGGGGLACFVARVVDVKEDMVGYAEITSGIVFELPNPVAVISRWTLTLEALRQVAEGKESYG